MPAQQVVWELLPQPQKMPLVARRAGWQVALHLPTPTRVTQQAARATALPWVPVALSALQLTQALTRPCLTMTHHRPAQPDVDARAS